MSLRRRYGQDRSGERRADQEVAGSHVVCPIGLQPLARGVQRRGCDLELRPRFFDGAHAGGAVLQQLLEPLQPLPRELLFGLRGLDGAARFSGLIAFGRVDRREPEERARPRSRWRRRARSRRTACPRRARSPAPVFLRARRCRRRRCACPRHLESCATSVSMPRRLIASADSFTVVRSVSAFGWLTVAAGS